MNFRLPSMTKKYKSAETADKAFTPPRLHGVFTLEKVYFEDWEYVEETDDPSN